MAGGLTLPEPVDCPSKLGFDAARLLRIDDWMQRNLDRGRYTGSSVLVGRKGVIAHLSAVGSCTVAQSRPYSRDTIVRIYSMTKPVTSVALMMLVEKGLLHLDAPASQFIPEFSNCMALVDGAQSPDQLVDAPVPTIQQLLTHTSGMTYAFNPGLLAGVYAKQRVDFGPGSGPLEEMVKRAVQMPLAFQPGSQWEYSVGIDVIGRVVEIVSGMTLDNFFQKEIFKPLGMKDTSFGVPPKKVERFADCQVKTEDNPLLLSDAATDSEFLQDRVVLFSGGGGLQSTLDDYFRFAEMLRLGGKLDGQRILSPRTVDFMTRNHLPGDIASMGPNSFAEMPMHGMGFGIGGAVVMDPALARIPGTLGDFGWGGMASTFFWIDPVEELTCIFFTQLIPSSSYPNRAELKALVHAALVD